MTLFYNCNKKLYTKIKKRENADFLKATVKKVAFSEKRIYYYLYVYDTNFVELAKQEWDIATDGSVLSLTDEDGKTSEYQQVTLEEAADIMTYPAFLVG